MKFYFAHCVTQNIHDEMTQLKSYVYGVSSQLQTIQHELSLINKKKAKKVSW